MPLPDGRMPEDECPGQIERGKSRAGEGDERGPSLPAALSGTRLGPEAPTEWAVGAVRVHDSRALYAAPRRDGPRIAHQAMKGCRMTARP